MYDHDSYGIRSILVDVSYGITSNTEMLRGMWTLCEGNGGRMSSVIDMTRVSI